MGNSAHSKKRRDRDFFYAILITLAHDYVSELVRDVRDQRMTARANKIHKP